MLFVLKKMNFYLRNIASGAIKDCLSRDLLTETLVYE